MAMLKLPLTMVIMAKMAIFFISVVALGMINMAIRGIQLKSMEKIDQWP